MASSGVVRLLEGTTTLVAYQATNSNVSISGDGLTVSVDFTSKIVEGKTYKIECDADFLKDADDNPLTGTLAWDVVMGDYTDPVLADTDPLVPANGQVGGVELDADLSITFSEDITVVDGSQIFVYTDNGTPHGDLFAIVDAADMTVAGSMLTIPVGPDFVASTKYYVVLTDGVVTDASVNENPFTGWIDHTSWVFTTRSNDAPMVTAASEANVTESSFDVVLQLDAPGMVYVMAVDEDVDPVNWAGAHVVSAEVEAAGTDVTVSLTNAESGALAEAMTYDVWVLTENDEDPATEGDAEKVLTVTTADVTAPEATAYDPAMGAVAADINEKDYMALQLSEEVMIGTGNIDVYTWESSTNHQLLVSVTAADCMLNEDKDSLFIPVDQSLWVSEDTYFVMYDDGIVTDMSGNELAGISSTEGWKFTVQDFLAPTYTVVPADGETEADETEPQITITFNEEVVIANITEAIILKNGDALVNYTPTVTPTVITLVIDPAKVESNASFVLSVDKDKIADLSGNTGTGDDEIAFTIRDYTGPVATIVPPMPGESDNLWVVFDEKVYKLDGSEITDADVADIVIFRKGIDINGDFVDAGYTVSVEDGKTVFVIDPEQDFTDPDEQYYVAVGPGAVIDASGNENDVAEAVLTISDFVAPTAEFTGIGTSPVNPGLVAPVIEFSEEMYDLDGTEVANTDATALVNMKEDGSIMPFTAVWDATGRMITITAIYTADKTYEISVGKSLEDSEGNAFNGVTTQFETWSTEAPVMVSVTPEDGATEQAADVTIEVTFDMDVTIADASLITVNGVPASIATTSGAVLTIGHAALTTDLDVVVVVGTDAVQAANGQKNAEEISWSFATEDTQDPQVVDKSDVIDAEDKLVLEFDEAIELKTGEFKVRNGSNFVVVMTLTEADAEVVDDVKLEINPTSALDYNTNYYVTISSGVVADLAGNTFGGYTGTEWMFSVGDMPVPTDDFEVVASNPEDGEDKIAAGISPITIEFNREIQALSATAKIKINDGSSDIIDDVANTGRFAIDGSTLSINTGSDIVADKTYTITLEAGVVTDNYDNASEAGTIVFYTMDNNAPEVASTAPVADAEGVDVETNIVLTWDETPYNIGGTAITAAGIKSNTLVSIDNGVLTSYTATINGDEWTLTLDDELMSETVYMVTVDLSKVEDTNGKAGTGTFTWSFTTEDSEVNAPTAFMITEDTEGTSIDFTVDFDEAGMVYYAVLPSADDAPTAAEIIAAGNAIVFDAAGTSDDETVADLMSGAEYKAYFVAVDVAGNESDIYAPAAFTTADVVKPMVVEMVPANGATDIEADVDLVLTFDEAVMLGAGTIVIRDVETDVVVAVIPVTVGNTTLSNDDKTATIDGNLSLGNVTEYYVEVAGGTFEDLAGNGMEAISGSDAWTFTTKDIVAPLLVATTPDHAAVPIEEIPVGTTLSLEFDEAMKIGLGTVYVRYANDDVFEVISADALSLSEDKMTISFGLSNVPAEQEEFYVDLSEIVFTDEADNAWVNTLGTDWNFIVLDQTAPALVSSTPEDDAVGVDIDVVISMEFSEAIYKAPDADEFNGVDAMIEEVVVLMDAAGDTVEATITIDAAYKVVTITPAEDLVSEAAYTVHVDPVVDHRKNVSKEIMVSFTTKDATPPTATWMPEYDTYQNPKTGVVIVTFSEDVYNVLFTGGGDPVMVEIEDADVADFFTYNMVTITRDVEGEIETVTPGDEVSFTGTVSNKRVMTLTPAADELPLASEAWYAVVLKEDAVVDAALNWNEEDGTIFHIEDQVAPEVVVDGYAPVGPVAEDDEMTITFNENVAIGSGSIVIRDYANGEVVEEIAVSESTVSIEDNIATITHANFPEAMDFFVTADAGAFVDTSINANPWAGIATDAIDMWNFSTADATPPVLVALLPASGAENVVLGADLKITLDKTIALNEDGEHYVVIYNEDWTPFEVIEVNSANMSIIAQTDPIVIPNRVVSIEHMPFEANSTYYVRVMSGSFLDLSGNKFAGIMDDTWTFTTEDNLPPVIVALLPADDATDVDPYGSLVIEFAGGVEGSSLASIKLYKEQPGQAVGTLIETIDPSSASVSIDANIATIMLTEPMEDETGYYVIVEAGSFTNTSSEKQPLNPGIETTQGWNFTTGIGVEPAPAIVSLSPHYETITDNHPTLVMTFDRNVMLGEEVSYLYVTEKDSADAHLMIEITTDMIVDNIVTVDYVFDPVLGGLKTDTEYFVTVDSAAVANSEGLAWDGIKDIDVWMFTTGSDFATGIEDEVVTTDFKVYPNPFNDRIFISNNDKLTRVVVSNIAGQRVIDVDYPENQIRTDNLVSGIYIVSLITEDGIAKTEKIIKK
ncbi:Ig-like domain-containing protein [Draconibacterium sp.]|nr:Ig-like domain-containing protein [Draconibacterium sp.]